MDSRLRTYLAEMAGTFLVVLVGAGTICADHLGPPPGPHVTAMALAEGFTFAVALTFAFYVSPGCLNPAVTVMQWVFRRLETRRAFALVAAQLVGATVAGLVLRVSFADRVLVEARLGAPYLKGSLLPEGSLNQVGMLISGTGVELLAAALITLAAMATLFDPRAPRLGGVVVGLAQAAGILFGYHLSGGVGNPARWFGPFLWLRTLEAAAPAQPLAEALIYCGGPVLGALAAAFFYHAVILPPARRPERHK
jgi:aquaporin Z